MFLRKGIGFCQQSERSRNRSFFSVLILFSHERIRMKVYVKFCDLQVDLIGML